MGLLDEAIREHLELKRRRGADPTEVEREEREALGPVRRVQQEASADGTPEVAGEAADHEFVSDLGDEHAEFEDHDDFAAEPELEYAPERDDYAVEEPLPGQPLPVEAPPAPEASEVHGVVPPPAPAPAVPDPEEPAIAEPRPPRAPDQPVYEEPGVETAEYDVEAEHAQEDEDVLEETPEFLQDAPEHDRLWFEQRPPKDFDFDG